VKVLALGVGDAFSARFYSSCLAIEAEGQWLLVDCPHPIRKMMREASTTAGVSLDVANLAGVALTHLHADHSSGLEGLGYFSFFALRRRMPLLAHPDVVADLWPHHLKAGMGQLIAGGGTPEAHHFEDYFEHTPLLCERPTHFGPFEIESRKTHHHIPTTAFRIRAGGRSFGVSADTSFDPGLVDWLAECDAFVHETNYGIHTPLERLTALPAHVRAKMRLIHYPDDLDPARSNIALLAQGDLHEI
jgi:ribonuclease BN (tRNA processing enzyme)